ncbi:MAG: 3(2),5-bisphosphate nucleotidase [Hyphomicrobiales bacterium]|jgi:3'(2'),5'-bisphosphate nucleotidase|nr:3(2),5-bisphosphate nucleotidase [Hyphomicrobiales bacterium]
MRPISPASTPEEPPSTALAQIFAQVAVEAGAVVMEVYGQDFALRTKADHSPVCDADERAEALILARLSEHFPALPVVAEEAVARGLVPDLGTALILVDPLDGTREFAKRNGEFTINIALVRDGVPGAAVVYAPARGRLWVAAGQAYACDVAPGADVPAVATMKPLRARKLGAGAPVAIASRSHRNAETEELLERLQIREMQEAGSALKFCLIAEGQADIYPRVGTTMEWDIAAGDAVLRAAGGIVTGLDGKPLLYGRREEGFACPDFVAFGDPDATARLARVPSL